MYYVVFLVVVTFTLLHAITSLLPSDWMKTRYDEAAIELFRRHHEICTMLGVIALAVMVKGF